MKKTRAWRRMQALKCRGDNTVRPLERKPEKHWKLMYTRAAKLYSAHQLGMSYPIRAPRQLLDQE